MKPNIKKVEGENNFYVAHVVMSDLAIISVEELERAILKNERICELINHDEFLGEYEKPSVDTTAERLSSIRHSKAILSISNIMCYEDKDGFGYNIGFSLLTGAPMEKYIKENDPSLSHHALVPRLLGSKVFVNGEEKYDNIRIITFDLVPLEETV